MSDASSRPKSLYPGEDSHSTRRNTYRKQNRSSTAHVSSYSSVSSRKGRSDPASSSMVVDYYYQMYHPEPEAGNEEDPKSRGRCCSFGTISNEVKGRKRCFVISPIGQEGSEVRQHADNVFSFIIMPAMHSRGIDCVRSDMITDLGQITDQMYEAIFKWDLCIAVLTFFNPNVFYELALRQCVGLPVICLMEKSQHLPFDVADLRVIEYSLKPTPLFSGTYAEQLQDSIDFLIQKNWKTDYSFSKFSPSICNAPNYFRSPHELAGAGDKENQWLDLFRRAGSRLDVMGPTMKHWKRCEDELKLAAARECNVRILIPDKDNESISSFFSCQGKQLEAYKLLLDHAFSFFAVIARTTPLITVRKVTRGMIKFGCCLSDKELFYQPVFYNFMTADETPVFTTDPKSALYHTVNGDFELLWNLNEASDSAVFEQQENS